MGLRSISIGLVTASLILAGGSAFAYDAEFDYNGDGSVDETDVEIIKASFNATEGDEDFDPIFDHDGDGFVGGSDIAATLAAAANN
jgi:hypothetical protein